MKWTDEKPDREGWWWYRFKPRKNTKMIIEVIDYFGRLFHWVDERRVWIDKLDGQWSDRPIDEPEEG